MAPVQYLSYLSLLQIRNPESNKKKDIPSSLTLPQGEHKFYKIVNYLIFFNRYEYSKDKYF
jgi:hypothetical protein